MPTDHNATRPVPPWVIDGIDYGPAITAAHDLAQWAFDLAERSVGHWPEGKKRLQRVRRDVIGLLRGRRAHTASDDDVWFAAGLLARIFDADLHLGWSDAIGILDELGLPTETVAVPRVTRASSKPSSVTPIRRAPTCFACGQAVLRTPASHPLPKAST